MADDIVTVWEVAEIIRGWGMHKQLLLHYQSHRYLRNLRNCCDAIFVSNLYSFLQFAIYIGGLHSLGLTRSS
jgi:hypothetical protein